MINELEVKILEIDWESLKEKLNSAWGIISFLWNLKNHFFKNNEGKKLRIREVWNRFIMTYKDRLETASIMYNEEYEVSFNKLEPMIDILKRIWFVKYWESSKYRISYTFDWIHFDFDTMEWIPEFVEVEANDFESLKKWVEFLWFSMDDTVSLTERQIKEHYNIPTK